jgi:hypothetical protein
MAADHCAMNLVYENSDASLGMFQQLDYGDGCRTAQSGLYNANIASNDPNQERLFDASIYGSLSRIKEGEYTYFGSYRDFILAKAELPAVSLTHGGVK